jgi:hypothetical protein
MTGFGRRAFVAASALVVLAAPAVAGAQTAAERELARRHAPVMVLKQNPDPPCSRSGEQYRPSPVGITLGNPTVRLVRPPTKGSFKQTRVLANGATAADIAELGPDYYLDLVGHPRRPGCTYARESERLMRGRSPVIYAHVAHERGVHGIALQYWFYYLFNQFNDEHESDWEMIQLAFDADSSEQALQREPTEVAYAQHNGGERHSWKDPVVEKEGAHPVVYVSSGSHASQFGSALYLGNGEKGSGLGCDDTRGPSFRLRPTAVVVSTFPAADASDAWLAYRGHWGQHEPGVSNGPTGPNMKRQWLEPFRWMSKLRTSSPKVPKNGEPVTGFFCGAVSSLSGVLNETSTSPLYALLVFAFLAVGVAALAVRTEWRPTVPKPLRRERAAGQIIDTSVRVYWEHKRLLVPIGLVAVVTGSIAVAAQALLFNATDLRKAFDALEDAKIEGIVALFVGILAHGFAPLVVGAAVVLVLRAVDRGERPGARTVLAGLKGEIWKLVGLGIGGLVAVFLLAATIIGLPLAVKKGVDWALVQQSAAFEGNGGRKAYAGSTGIIRGHWWRTAAIAAVLFLLLLLLGPVTGIFIIFVTDAPLSTINLIGSALFVLVLPYAAVCLTLLHLDLTSRRRQAAAETSSPGMLPPA